jgi:ketosteroid isomerase-like protein
MSQENVEVVQQIIDAINRRDVDAVLESATEDFVTDWSNSRGLMSGVHQGRGQAREAFETFLEPWDSLRWEPEELIELGR